MHQNLDNCVLTLVEGKQFRYSSQKTLRLTLQEGHMVHPIITWEVPSRLSHQKDPLNFTLETSLTIQYDFTVP